MEREATTEAHVTWEIVCMSWEIIYLVNRVPKCLGDDVCCSVKVCGGDGGSSEGYTCSGMSRLEERVQKII